MNQLSAISFGSDATSLRGYAQAANERLGAVDFVVENTGDIALVFQLRAFDGSTSPSGYANVGAQTTVNPRGTKTISYTLLGKRVGFFGSGVAANVTTGGTTKYVTSATANVTAVMRNKGDLRGAQIDLVAVGRKSWGYDEGYAYTELKKKWGTVASGGGAVVQPGLITPSNEGV
jgi:hypothetical protein